MNGKHVHSKLKNHNKILKILVAFFLLSLMVPKMSFAEEPTVQLNDNAIEETSNEVTVPLTDAPSNNVTMSGIILDENAQPIDGAFVAVLKNGKMIGSGYSFWDGKYSFTLFGVSVGDQIFLDVWAVDYCQSMLSYVVENDSVALDFTLSTGVNTCFKVAEGHKIWHTNFLSEFYIDGVKFYSEVSPGEGSQFFVCLPVGSKITMTDRAHVDYSYINSAGQIVRVHTIANGADWYKAYWWGIDSTSGLHEAMPVNKSYTLTDGSEYTLSVNYKELTMLDFSSTSEHHNYFDIDYVKNGAPYVNLQQASFQSTTFAGATCKVCDDGKIEVFFDDTDPIYTYKVVGYITPVAKAGYKLANWTYNGQTLKAGDSFIAQEQTTMAFVANYEVDASQAPQTGDMTYIFVLALIALVAVASVGVIRYRKNY